MGTPLGPKYVPYTYMDPLGGRQIPWRAHGAPHTPSHMGGCQNHGPFLGTLNVRCRSMIGIPKRGHNFDNHPYECT